MPATAPYGFYSDGWPIFLQNNNQLYQPDFANAARTGQITYQSLTPTPKKFDFGIAPEFNFPNPNFPAIDWAEVERRNFGLLPAPRSLISPWDTAPQQRRNTYTNIYGQQFTTPQQINLSRFSSNPASPTPLYMNQDIANILSSALGY